MKTLKFRQQFVPQILNRSKTSTWRVFDDKNLQAGDKLQFINKDTGEMFAKAVIKSVKIKKLKDLTRTDYADGHGNYKSGEDRLEKFKEYYGDKVNFDSVLKIVHYNLINEEE